jgi:hypothetical protein
VRRVLHLGAVASLLLSFVQAPFLHAHASDPHHEHAQGFTPTHWNTSPSEGASWEADDHNSDARMIQWLAGDGSAPGKFLPALPESVAQTVLTVQVARIPELTSHNHDPPDLLTLHPRGPPA